MVEGIKRVGQFSLESFPNVGQNQRRRHGDEIPVSSPLNLCLGNKRASGKRKMKCTAKVKREWENEASKERKKKEN